MPENKFEVGEGTQHQKHGSMIVLLYSCKSVHGCLKKLGPLLHDATGL
jgi:hypothetical protein